MENNIPKETIEDMKTELLKEEIQRLKTKINELRSNNNSFIYTALIKMQSELPIIQKNASTFGKQRYADFAEIVRISRPYLVKYGLGVTQTFVVENGQTILITILCHVSGQDIRSRVRLVLASADSKNGQNMLQEHGKSMTYLKRYAYCAIVGIATDDDTDGNWVSTETEFRRKLKGVISDKGEWEKERVYIKALSII